MPKLILKFEAAVIKELPMTGSAVMVGRESDNDIVIDHPAVSRHHCKIMLQGDTYFVEDLNSTNGTLVNGKKIIKAGIHNQDVVAIAKHSIVFVDDRAVTPEDIARQMEAQSAPAAAPPAAPAHAAPRGIGKIGGLRVMEGGVDNATDYPLTEASTYIGKSDRAAIKIKGAFAPDVAAMISKKSDGYVLVAVKEGYPKVNDQFVETERPLAEGDVLELGGTKFQFYLRSA